MIIDSGILIDYVYVKDINVKIVMILIYYSYYEVFELIIFWVFNLFYEFIFELKLIDVK